MRLITEIDIGATHDIFAVWLHSLDRGRRTSKDTDELAVVGHCWCTKHYPKEALADEQDFWQASCVVPGHLNHVGVSVSLSSWTRQSEDSDEV